MFSFLNLILTIILLFLVINLRKDVSEIDYIPDQRRKK